jgi:hypothetical protein
MHASVRELAVYTLCVTVAGVTLGRVAYVLFGGGSAAVVVLAVAVLAELAAQRFIAAVRAPVREDLRPPQ